MEQITYNIVSAESGEVFERNLSMYEVKNFVEDKAITDAILFLGSHPFTDSSKFVSSGEYKNGVGCISIRKLVDGEDIGCSYSIAEGMDSLEFTTDEEFGLEEIFSDAIEMAEKEIDSQRLTYIMRYIKAHYPSLKVAYNGGSCAIYGFWNINEFQRFMDSHENMKETTVALKYGGQVSSIDNYYDDTYGYVPGRGLDLTVWDCDNAEVEMYKHGMSREQLMEHANHWIIDDNEEDNKKIIEFYERGAELIERVKEDEMLVLSFMDDAEIEKRYVMSYDDGHYIYELAAGLDLIF